MKVLLDQGLPRSSAQLLRSAGIDAIHTGECGMTCASDRRIMDFTKAEGRIIVSLDSDFHVLLALSKAQTPSVVRIRIEGLHAEAAAIILKAIENCRNDLVAGCVASVQAERIRLRKLPIAR